MTNENSTRVAVPDDLMEILDQIASSEDEFRHLIHHLKIDPDEFAGFVHEHGLAEDEFAREICGILSDDFTKPLIGGEARRSLQIGDIAPNFVADTTEGQIAFHDWIEDSWALLFSHPRDFTPVSTTELGYIARIKPEFEKRKVKIIGLSVDPVHQHSRWAHDIQKTLGFAPNYPMIGDTNLRVSKLYGMLPSPVSESDVTSPAENQTLRNVFIIGPDKRIKLILVYPLTTGRNFDEILRVIDSLQLTAKHKVVTPVNWKQGEDVIIAGSVSDEDAKNMFPQGWKIYGPYSPYIRIVTLHDDEAGEISA